MRANQRSQEERERDERWLYHPPTGSPVAEAIWPNVAAAAALGTTRRVHLSKSGSSSASKMKSELFSPISPSFGRLGLRFKRVNEREGLRPVPPKNGIKCRIEVS